MFLEPFIKEIIFLLQVYIFVTSVESQMALAVWGYFWVLSSIAWLSLHVCF